MDGIADSVSNILNSTVSGVGDISGWLASNGLPGYASAKTAQLIAICIIAIAFLIVSFVIAVLSLNKAVNCETCEDELYLLIAIVSGSVFAISVAVLCFSFQELVGWMSSPDGMILNSIIKSISG